MHILPQYISQEATMSFFHKVLNFHCLHCGRYQEAPFTKYGQIIMNYDVDMAMTLVIWL